MLGVVAEVSVEMPNIAINTPLWLAILTTGVGAIQGAAIGRSDENESASIDVIGMSVFALFLGMGGGFVRDTMLGNTPFVALRTPWYLLTVIAAVVLVLLIGRWIPVGGALFTLFDALTLGLYSAIGTQYALDFKVSTVGALLVGTAAGIAGGVLVAILRNQTPAILVSGPPYAILALLSSAVYLSLAHLNGGIASFAAVTLVVVVRFVTLRLGIKTPTVHHLHRHRHAENGLTIEDAPQS